MGGLGVLWEKFLWKRCKIIILWILFESVTTGNALTSRAFGVLARTVIHNIPPPSAVHRSNGAFGCLVNRWRWCCIAELQPAAPLPACLSQMVWVRACVRVCTRARSPSLDRFILITVRGKKEPLWRHRFVKYCARRWETPWFLVYSHNNILQSDPSILTDCLNEFDQKFSFISGRDSTLMF